MGMTPQHHPAAADEAAPIYNSRIIATYLEYLKKNRPDVDASAVLQKAGISRYEALDPAHWFNQQQIDRFHEALQAAAGDPSIARAAGRFIASGESIGPLRAFAVGLLNPATSYMLVSRMAEQVSRGAALSVKRAGRGAVEITSRPEPGVAEKPFQCENRLGTFEGMAEALTGRLARVSHPECWHRGDPCCRYQVTWRRTAAGNWKLARNGLTLAVLAGVPAAVLLRPDIGVAATLALSALAVAVAAVLAERVEKKELARNLKIQGDIGSRLIEETNIRYGNALLVQEIGQAAATIRDRSELVRFVVNAVEQRLDYDRGMIMLADAEQRRLHYAAGFGYPREKEHLLRSTAFHLDRPDSKGLFVRAFWEQRPFLIEDIEQIEADLSERSRKFARELGARTLICVPIVYEKSSFGILAVDNIGSKRPLNKSDMNLLMGVASQTAASMANAKAFEDLAQSEEKYRSVLEGIEEGYFEVDPKGSLTFFNDALCRIAARSGSEMAGLNYRCFMSEESARRADRLFRRLYENGRPMKARELEILRPDGTLRLLEVSATLIRGTDGAAVGVRGLARDVTERRRDEEERRKLEAQLVQAQKLEAVGTLAGGVAHDFNNLLMGIRGNASLMMMDMDPEDPMYEKLESIEAYVEKSARLTRQLLGFARKGTVRFQPVNLNESITKSSELFGRTCKEIRIRRRLDANLWSVEADPGQIEQVLLNLYVNSLHAMPDGGDLVIESENVDLPESRTKRFERDPGRYARVRVSDTGVGMDEEVLQRIFEPFFTTKKPGEGTGLGLASVYGIMKNHNGFVDVRSRVGHGTEFALFFPAAEKVLKADEVGESDAIGGTETLLIIDDEQMILDVTSEMLATLGYRVETARSGADGIEMFRRDPHRIGLVILDMVMPEMSGAQVFAALKEIDPTVTVLLASGYSAEGHAEQMLKDGCRGFIQKPFDIRRLSQKIRSVLETSI